MWIIQTDSTGQDEHPLFARQFIVIVEQINDQQEGEEKLVLFEERSAHILVKRSSKVFFQVSYASVHLFHRLRVIDRHFEEIDEPIQ